MAAPLLPNPPLPALPLEAREPKPPLLCAAPPKPPPNELPGVAAPSVLVDPKVLRVVLAPKLLPVEAAAPKLVGAPKLAPPKEVAGLLLLAPKAAALAAGAAPKVGV